MDRVDPKAFLKRLALLASGTLILSAQTPTNASFADLVRTPANLQIALERCDGNPEFETALANWLETAEPSLPADREAVHKASLRLLEDTNDGQLVLGLLDGLLRHALEDMKRNQTISSEELARALYADIGRAVRAERSKAKAIFVLADGLAEDGTVKDVRQARFLQSFMNISRPRIVRIAAPARPPIGDAARASREQAGRKSSSPTP
jgi:hypothetical protein